MRSRTAFIQMLFHFLVSQLLQKIYNFLKFLANCPVFFVKKINSFNFFFLRLRLLSLFCLACCLLPFTLCECTFPLARSCFLNCFCSSACLCCVLLAWVSNALFGCSNNFTAFVRQYSLQP